MTLASHNSCRHSEKPGHCVRGGTQAPRSSWGLRAVPSPCSSLACGFGTPAAPPPGEMIQWVFWLHAESVGALPVQLGVGRRGLTV